ncbi:MAG: hypothetical protein ACTSPW_20445 [Promethearchaeota archaeon]
MFYTIIAGVLVFIFSQYFLKIILEPILEVKRTISMIDFSLIFYAYIYSNINIYYEGGYLKKDLPEELRTNVKEMKKEFRRLSSLLKTQVYTIYLYHIFHSIFFLPEKNSINIACRNLIGLSNISDNFPLQNFINKAEDIKLHLNLNMDI